MEKAQRSGFVQVNLSVRPEVAALLDRVVQDRGWTKVKALEVGLMLLDMDRQPEAEPRLVRLTPVRDGVWMLVER